MPFINFPPWFPVPPIPVPVPAAIVNPVVDFVQGPFKPILEAFMSRFP